MTVLVYVFDFPNEMWYLLWPVQDSSTSAW